MSAYCNLTTGVKLGKWLSPTLIDGVKKNSDIVDATIVT